MGNGVSGLVFVLLSGGLPALIGLPKQHYCRVIRLLCMCVCIDDSGCHLGCLVCWLDRI